MGWYQLLSTAREQRDYKRQEQIGAPVSCPFDGERLDINASGVRNCRFGNYRWDGGEKTQPNNR